MSITLNGDAWKQWERVGKTELVKQCKALTKDKNGSLQKAGGSIARAIYEMLSRAIRGGSIRKESVLGTLNELTYLHNDMPSIILDVIGVLDAETSVSVGGEAVADERNSFCQIVRETEKFLSEKLLKERLEIDTLQDDKVGIVKNGKFYTKFIKVKTKLYYKQRRFNLFREESEGYAKLITELNQDFGAETTVQNTLEIVKSLIGCFNLDPNRVLDIIVESFETHPEQSKLFIPLLESYMPDGNIICEVLGYKYRHFATDAVTPSSLYLVTALLLQYGVIGLDDIYVWLSPTDREITGDWDQEMDEAKEFVRKLNIIATNKDAEPPVAEHVEMKESALETKFGQNQKFGLCKALLMVGDWKTAEQLMKKFPDQAAVVQEPIAKALTKLIHTVIEPVYREKCPMASRGAPGKPAKDVWHNSSRQWPQAHTIAELKQYAFPMFLALGPSLHFDPILVYKLVRLMKVILNGLNVDAANLPSGEEAEVLYHDVLSLMDTCILASLSYLDCNCCLAEEIWSVMKIFPYQYRFCLYARWKNDTYQSQPKLIWRRGEAQKQIKSLMKRVSKENIKPIGRLIGKLSHCSPGFLFDYILLQIQFYDNLIGPVVDSLKYLTSLSYDMLGYCLIESLSQVNRDRFKHDGTSLSMWLQNLANFCGAIYKKYNIELSGLLQYVANQLKAQKSLDLLVLKEVVQKMAGIEAAEEMTNDQLKALCGGEQLRSEAGYFSQVRNTKKSSQRLKDALASNDLSVALCLLIAQQKHCIIYKETTAAQSHLKLVGKLYDQCQDTLVQFGTFLGSTYSVDEYVERLPSIHSMLQEYHMHSDVAFFLARPMFSHQISQKYDQLRKSDPNGKKLTTTQKQVKYLEATAAVMNPIVESVRPLHLPKVWEDISTQFLVTFWSLSMYDLQVPADIYLREVNKLKQLSVSVLESKEMNSSKGKKEQERYLALIEKLQDERKKQQEHVDKIMHRLEQEKDTWFLSRAGKSVKNETITQFLQLCLFPRCTFTALDALYCAKFVHTIHSLKTANFSTLLCYDRLFCDITYSVTSCTENEAGRYGRFLCAMLETVMRWHADQATFNKECANYPGFVTKFKVSNQCTEANDHVGYENYRHVCHKWHYKITKAMVFCLESKDFVQIRNALIILKKILPHFPVITKLSQIIERKVEKVCEDERHKRPDVFTLASSYMGQLKTKAAQMMRECDFHQVAATVNGSGGGSGDAVTSTTKNEAAVKREQVAGPKKVPISSANGGNSNSSNSNISSAASNNASSIGVNSKAASADRADSVKKEPQGSASVTNNSSSGGGHHHHHKESSVSRQQQQQDDLHPGAAAGKEKTPKELRREERKEQRDREGSEPVGRKREKEQRRREKKVEREVSPEFYEYYGDRERDRDLSSVSNSSNGSATHRHSQEPELERDLKRRKVDHNSSSSSGKKQQELLEYRLMLGSAGGGGGGGDLGLSAVASSSSSSVGKKDGRSGGGGGARSSSKLKEKREKTDEEKEQRKERKLGRKRDRAEEAQIAEQKRRKDEDKEFLAKVMHQNGDDDLLSHRSDKHYHLRDKSPYGGGGRDHRERSHDRLDTRDKQYSTFTKSSRTRSGYQ